MIDNHILEIANQASLNILTEDKRIDIKHKFRLSDKSNIGMLFFLCGGIFFIVAPYIKTSDTTTKVLGILFGLILLTFSLLTIIRQVFDGLQIKDNTISFRHNLKRTILPLNIGMKVKMKTELIKIRRVGTLGSDYILVTHYLQNFEKEIPILTFQMEKRYEDNARKLGNEITRIINAKF